MQGKRRIEAPRDKAADPGAIVDRQQQCIVSIRLVIEVENQVRLIWIGLIQGIIWATVIGCIAGLFPAIRAARLPIAAALRAL